MRVSTSNTELASRTTTIVSSKAATQATSITSTEAKFRATAQASATTTGNTETEIIAPLANTSHATAIHANTSHAFTNETGPQPSTSQAFIESDDRLVRRYDLYNHFPEFSDKKSRSKCNVCKQLTYVFCPKCSVFLCFIKQGRNCFKDYHHRSDTL